MKFRCIRLLILLAACGSFAATQFTPDIAGQTQRKRAAVKKAQPKDSFQTVIVPFINENCAFCHGVQTPKGGLDLTAFHSSADISKQRERWEAVLDKIRSGEMPPKGLPRPDANQAKTVTAWFDAFFAKLDREIKPDPGRVTARRLNRFEYDNTVRDLLAVDFKPAEDFPADDTGYGFDNIGDVLSLSPLLMEKYLQAAEKIAYAAIPLPANLKPAVERFNPEKLQPVNAGNRAPHALEVTHNFPVEADYDLQADLSGAVLPYAVPVKLTIWLDGREITTAEFSRQKAKPWNVGKRVKVKPGRHTVRYLITPGAVKPEDSDPAKARVGFNALVIRGPFNLVPPSATAGYQRVFTCGHAYGQHLPACGEQVLSNLARRAYRRPVTPTELNALMGFVTLAQQNGDNFEQGVRVALQALLVSPKFLFRIEQDPAVKTANGIGRLNDFELAARLSYFLWSSMPDDELLRLAETQQLRQPAVFNAQVARLLSDPKAAALVENFAGQWLQLRNLELVKPDPDRFPNFTAELREAMRRETELFFSAILKEDRSLVDFLDGRFTFLNETLARHYGLPGITGREFRRVELEGTQRSGVLTQASILTISSYPTRTSPVIRGKWILENILNAPPPPPPADVPLLDEKTVGLTGSLRQQMEQHRANPVCSSCHARMDPLGFGLENYDAIGAWRVSDGKFPVEATGVLPNGKAFKTPLELKAILQADRDAFTRCLTEKLLIYALGRGLERYDKPVVQSIVQRVAADHYRLNRLILEIANSYPFQQRRATARPLTTKSAGRR
jgi:mono/diheme cytochrome c family protein